MMAKKSHISILTSLSGIRADAYDGVSYIP
nr:MAG TPA: hypothetical protein [Caudoviricetes sp.]